MIREALLPLLFLFTLAIVMPGLRQDGDLPPEALMAAREEASPAPASGGEAASAVEPTSGAQSALPMAPARPSSATAAANVSLPHPRVACSEQSSNAEATFTWTPLAGAVDQWLDISYVNDGFKTDTRLTTGSLGATTSSFTWKQLATDKSPVFWRINTLTQYGWQPEPVQLLSPCAPFGLQTTVGCGNQPSIDFAWQPSPLPVLLQWLEVSAFDNGFAAGTFQSVGPIAADQTSLSWADLPGNALVWRVHSLTTKGWRSSETRTIAGCNAPELLQPRYTCVGDRAVVEFRWAPMSHEARQWLDLSYQLNGFAPGTFVNSGELPVDAENHLWPGIQANVPHFYRVHAQTPDGWRGSVTRSFTASCPGS